MRIFFSLSTSGCSPCFAERFSSLRQIVVSPVNVDHALFFFVTKGLKLDVASLNARRGRIGPGVPLTPVSQVRGSPTPPSALYCASLLTIFSPLREAFATHTTPPHPTARRDATLSTPNGENARIPIASALQWGEGTF